MKNKNISTVIALLLIAFGSILYTRNEDSRLQNPQTPQSVTSNPKVNLIQVDFPVPNTIVTSPLAITGKARGFWFFEASFPVVLLDGNGKEIVVSYATAQGEWMTEEFVPFSASITFEKPETATGTLVLKKDNPSGDPVRDDEVRIPVQFF